MFESAWTKFGFGCQGDGKRCVADAMLWEPSLAEMGCDPMDDLGFPLTDSPLVFLNASAEAVSAFDFSELTGVLSSNESIGSLEAEAEAPADVFVPGVREDTIFYCLVAESCRWPCVFFIIQFSVV